MPLQDCRNWNVTQRPEPRATPATRIWDNTPVYRHALKQTLERSGKPATAHLLGHQTADHRSYRSCLIGPVAGQSTSLGYLLCDLLIHTLRSPWASGRWVTDIRAEARLECRQAVSTEKPQLTGHRLTATGGKRPGAVLQFVSLDVPTAIKSGRFVHLPKEVRSV